MKLIQPDKKEKVFEQIVVGKKTCKDGPSFEKGTIGIP